MRVRSQVPLATGKRTNGGGACDLRHNKSGRKEEIEVDTETVIRVAYGVLLLSFSYL